MLGQYRAIAKLGMGGMAEVRLALAQRAGGFNKLLVLKLLREELTSDPEFREMFLTEAKVAALLNHPNIVQTNEVGTEDGRYFMAMEYLEGQPLSALLARTGRRNMPIDLHAFALAQVLHGLHYAHELTDLNGKTLSVIHRDVSPQNIFLTYTGQVKLLDFGIAKIAGSATFTRTGVVKGKLGYMAPEQARMAANIDRRADVFAVGVMLWEALAKQRYVPKGEAEAVTLQRRLANEDQKLLEVVPDADPKLAEICNKAVAYDPDDRWPDAQTFAEAIEGWLPSSKQVLERQLGVTLADNFREERSKIRRVIEEASTKTAEIDEASSPDLGKILSSIDTGNSKPSGDSSSGAATSGLVVNANAGQSKLWRTLSIGLVLAIGIGAGVYLLRKPRPAEGGSATLNPDPRPSATVASEISLRVRAIPPTATLSINDGPQRPMPYDGRVPKDGASHRLKIIADGYEPEERLVEFDRDLDFEVALRKRPVEPAASAAPAATNGTRPASTRGGQASARPKPSTAPTETPAPTTTTPPKKPKTWIDENDPYQK